MQCFGGNWFLLKHAKMNQYHHIFWYGPRSKYPKTKLVGVENDSVQARNTVKRQGPPSKNDNRSKTHTRHMYYVLTAPHILCFHEVTSDFRIEPVLKVELLDNDFRFWFQMRKALAAVKIRCFQVLLLFAGYQIRGEKIIINCSWGTKKIVGHETLKGIRDPLSPFDISKWGAILRILMYEAMLLVSPSGFSADKVVNKRKQAAQTTWELLRLHDFAGRGRNCCVRWLFTGKPRVWSINLYS